MSIPGVWKLVLGIGVVATIILAVGLTLAMGDIMYPKGNAISKGEDKQAANGVHQDNKVQIVALGDSLTRGTGDETGKGYVGWLKDELGTALKKDVYVLNHGINGYGSENILNDLKTKEDIRNSVKEGDIIVLSIGANDLFHAGQEEINPEVIRNRFSVAENSMVKVLDTLHQLNKDAPILCLGLYNPFSDLTVGKETGVLVNEWNNRVRQVVSNYPKMVYVPTEDLFSINGTKYLSSDHYHPNGEGYKQIGIRMAQVLK